MPTLVSPKVKIRMNAKTITYPDPGLKVANKNIIATMKIASMNSFKDVGLLCCTISDLNVFPLIIRVIKLCPAL